MDEFVQELNEQKATERYARINLVQMIQSRIREIVNIENACKKKLPKLYCQRVPRFMRRRAASHDPRRMPLNLRSLRAIDFGITSHKSLRRKRRRLIYRKHKRLLKKYQQYRFKDPFKCLIHKWFAKRFKMGANPGPLAHVPIHNNNKNQRNLYRETVNGCCYLSLGHLIAIEITLSNPNVQKALFQRQLAKLNLLTTPESGFTFSARALAKGRYEVCVHFCQLKSPYEYIGPAIIRLKLGEEQPATLIMWVTRDKHEIVLEQLEALSKTRSAKNPHLFTYETIKPRLWTRIRLVGPKSHARCLKIATYIEQHKEAHQDASSKLIRGVGLTCGRVVDEFNATYTYYNTKPLTADIVFKLRDGRKLWYDLTKNNAHLVGGYRDLDRLLMSDCFSLKPDTDTQPTIVPCMRPQPQVISI